MLKLLSDTAAKKLASFIKQYGVDGTFNTYGNRDILLSHTYRISCENYSDPNGHSKSRGHLRSGTYTRVVCIASSISYGVMNMAPSPAVFRLAIRTCSRFQSETRN